MFVYRYINGDTSVLVGTHRTQMDTTQHRFVFGLVWNEGLRNTIPTKLNPMQSNPI